jgi:hypothetical protein
MTLDSYSASLSIRKTTIRSGMESGMNAEQSVTNFFLSHTTVTSVVPYYNRSTAINSISLATSVIDNHLVQRDTQVSGSGSTRKCRHRHLPRHESRPCLSDLDCVRLFTSRSLLLFPFSPTRMHSGLH